MRQTRFQPKLVNQIPEELEHGILYISLPFSTSIHLCACGCGNEVVTPLSVDDWVVILDGENASLYPSIGNWSFPCHSHYWIRHGKVVEAEDWSEWQIQQNREFDRPAKTIEEIGTKLKQESSQADVEHDNKFSVWEYIRRYIWRSRR